MVLSTVRERAGLWQVVMLCQVGYQKGKVRHLEGEVPEGEVPEMEGVRHQMAGVATVLRAARTAKSVLSQGPSRSSTSQAMRAARAATSPSRTGNLPTTMLLPVQILGKDSSGRLRYDDGAAFFAAFDVMCERQLPLVAWRQARMGRRPGTLHPKR